MTVFLGFFFFFCPNKISPKKLFNYCLFFKEKTPLLFIFAIVYKKKKCVLIAVRLIAPFGLNRSKGRAQSSRDKTFHTLTLLTDNNRENRFTLDFKITAILLAKNRSATAGKYFQIQFPDVVPRRCSVKRCS